MACAARWLGIGAAAFASSLAGALAGTPALALEAVALSPDITIGPGGLVVQDEAAAVEFGAGVAPLDLGPLPPGASVTALDTAVSGTTTLFALDGHAELVGVIARPGDVVGWDGVAHAIFWDATAAGLPARAKVDGIALGPSGVLYLSFDVDVELAGLAVQDHDIIRIAPGGGVTFEFSDPFDDYGVRAFDVDAVTLLPDQKIGMSFDVGGIVGGVVFDDEDVLSFDANDESWAMVFDASSVRAEYAGAPDIEAVTVPEPGRAAALLGGVAMLVQLGRMRRGRRGVIARG